MRNGVMRNKDLFVRRSSLPNSGKGLFTRKDIPEGTLIVEYKGKVSNWKNANHKDGKNPYIYYRSRNFVIDAAPFKNHPARYANDARGLTKKRGLRNNAEYAEIGDKVFIKANKDIPAGSEILVSYGKEYWDAIRYNKKLDEKEKSGK